VWRARFKGCARPICGQWRGLLSLTGPERLSTHWALLLHFYQPPTQLPYVLRQIVRESYRPLIQLLADNPHARVTVNINGVLTEMLMDHAYQDVVEGLAWLAERGQVEFTGSAKYHPILPLLPEEEMRRQIRSNYNTNRRYLGPAYGPRGFFPPEMCYSDRILGPVVDFGHDWVTLSGIACHGQWPTDVVQRGNPLDAPISFIFRDDILSNGISFQALDAHAFLEKLRNLGRHRRGDVYVVTAMDAETYGHHITGWVEGFLGEVYRAVRADMAGSPAQQPANSRGLVAAGHVPAAADGASRVRAPRPSNGDGEGRQFPLPHQVLGMERYHEEDGSRVRLATVSEIVDNFPHIEGCWPLASSWSTTADDLARGVPYPLWNDPANHVHGLLWEHLTLCIELQQQAEQCADNPPSQWHASIARNILDTALHSCQFWWASRRPHWEVNMVFRGLADQGQAALNSSRAVELSGASREQKRLAWRRRLAAVEMYRQIMDELVRS
jgi:hypothetical protein